jgi:hypothetical protein
VLCASQFQIGTGGQAVLCAGQFQIDTDGHRKVNFVPSYYDGTNWPEFLCRTQV